MRLTKKRVIELTLELWTWLYENPMRGKTDWPEWIGNGGKLDGVESNCFCCEYDQIIGDNDCQKCPLLPLWPLDCMTGDTIYYNWHIAKNSKTRKKYAKQIVDFCKKEMAK